MRDGPRELIVVEIDDIEVSTAGELLWDGVSEAVRGEIEDGEVD